MKKISSLCPVLALVGFLGVPAYGALTVTNFEFTATSLKFDISGTITGVLPFGDMTYIFLVDANGNRNYDTTSVFNSGTIISNISVNGNANGVDGFLVENSGTTEDRFTMIRNAEWKLGDAITGSFHATWTTTVDAGNAPNGLDFRWGREFGDGGISAYNAPILTVPEPSVAVSLSGAVLVYAASRRRRCR